MKNIILIGMPGAGKSTIGVLLAKTLLMSFTDTDLLIQNKYGKALSDIISERGTKSFLEIEEDVICKVNCSNTVVATGGSAVYGNAAMERLKTDGITVYLKLSPEIVKSRISDIRARGVALPHGTTIDEVFAERKPLYEKYADITVDCENKTPERIVDEINAAFLNFGADNNDR